MCTELRGSFLLTVPESVLVVVDHSGSLDIRDASSVLVQIHVRNMPPGGEAGESILTIQAQQSNTNIGFFDVGDPFEILDTGLYQFHVANVAAAWLRLEFQYVRESGDDVEVVFGTVEACTVPTEAVMQAAGTSAPPVSAGAMVTAILTKRFVVSVPGVTDRQVPEADA